MGWLRRALQAASSRFTAVAWISALGLACLSSGCGNTRLISSRVISAMNVGAAQELPGPQFDAALSALRDEGVQLVRSDAAWGLIQPQPPVPGDPGWRWAQTDAWVSAFARHGLAWEPILDYSAGWAKTCPGFCAPTSDSTYAAFAQAVAARYGVDGAFWRAHPQLSRHPARIFEIWNEENVSTYLVAPARYASLYAAARQSIHAVDPTASVIVGGLAEDSGSFSVRQDYASQYVQTMFAAQPGLVGHADGFGLHPYGATGPDVEEWTVNFRRTLDSLGEQSVPIYITEVGWPTGVARGESWRAQQMSLVAAALSRSNCGIRFVAPYDWINPGAVGDFGLAGPGAGAASLRPAGLAWFQALSARGPELRLCPE